MDSIDDYPLSAAEPVPHPVMLQSWKHLTFLHWAYDPEVVQKRLPSGLKVDTYDGRAWVGLVAFRMEGIRLPRSPAVPYLGTFPETNVRTYVRGPDGRPGVWFVSLDINRLIPVLVARWTYRLPYCFSKMVIRHDRDNVAYTARRRWPQPRGAQSTIAVRPGTLITATHLERFLTARWGLFSVTGRRPTFAPVEHVRWPLHRAKLIELDDHLVTAAGYPPPAGDPIVHYSPGVDVRIGRPRRLEA